MNNAWIKGIGVTKAEKETGRKPVRGIFAKDAENGPINYGIPNSRFDEKGQLIVSPETPKL